MRIIILFLALIFTTSSTGIVQARPMDATGSCPMGASLHVASGRYQGNAQAMKSVESFMKLHKIAAEQEAPWSKLLTGPSGKNRIYHEKNQEDIVITVCNPADCEHNRAYIVYEPATGIYGGAYYEGRQVREFSALPGNGITPAAVGSALICAQNLDWAAK